MLVKQVLCHLVVVGIHASEVGNVVTKLLNGLHLLVQVVALQEVAQLWTGEKSGWVGTAAQSEGMNYQTGRSLSNFLTVLVTTYMRISMIRGQFVQIQQSLVDILLQLQGTRQGLQPTSPLITLWFLQKKKGIQLQHTGTFMYTV